MIDLFIAILNKILKTKGTLTSNEVSIIKETLKKLKHIEKQYKPYTKILHEYGKDLIKKKKPLETADVKDARKKIKLRDEAVELVLKAVPKELDAKLAKI